MIRPRLLFLVLLLVTVSIGTAVYFRQAPPVDKEPPSSGMILYSALPRIQTPPPIKGFAGHYLTSRFAQIQNDWDRAAEDLETVLRYAPEDPEILRRAMVLSMGAGDIKTAARHAKTFLEADPEDSVTLLILATSEITNGRISDAKSHITAMPDGDLTAFIRPLLQGWITASEGGKLPEILVNGSPVHRRHGAMIAHYAGQHDIAETLKKSLPPEMADSLQQAKDPVRGTAWALSDTAAVLFREGSTVSAQLFARMALAIDPSIIDAKLLLAGIAIQHDRPEEAVGFFSSIPQDHDRWLEIQRHTAMLLAQAERMEEAKTLLKDLFTAHDDVEALISLGDLYREAEDYNSALKAYNRAAGHIAGDQESEIPEKYWHLLYARGMAYEREGAWDKAESDLKAALTYQPDHPYLLNYLGYGWADQGLHLDESRKLLERAAALRPRDGYIADSLGWVLYRMEDYAAAVPHLEKAVELLPYDPTINDHLGDVYWQTGRYLEARFQWRRALNHSEDDSIKTTLQDKIDGGLPEEEKIVNIEE